jgi:transcriptional regulator with GAF, ATPase, and Fis domain
MAAVTPAINLRQTRTRTERSKSWYYSRAMTNDKVGEGSPLAATQGIETDRPYARVPRLDIHVVAGPDAGKRISSKGQRTVLGTEESADLTLTDRTVSRFHCELVVGEDDPVIILRDLGSRNGTKVDGVRVIEAILDNDATLVCGRSRIEVSFAPDHVDVPLSTEAHFGLMVGASKAMRAVFAMLERAAKSDATVLLQGETGSGKDAAAESIHVASTRSEGPLVVVDSGAIPAGLMESELFGHEKGAFTGADRARMGAFEAANGGTLFLDEIGELPLDLQPKLLRALDRRQIQRVGTSGRIDVDVRVIAATNRNLREEVNAGRFRADLYYRLAVVEILLPPLRERREDVPLLAKHILGSLFQELPEHVTSDEFTNELSNHPWPGNVRELRNHLERCVAMGEAMPLPTGEAPVSGDAPPIDFDQPLPAVRQTWTRFVERKYLQEMLRRHDNNVSAAARAAGVDRTSFYRLLTRCGLR